MLQDREIHMDNLWILQVTLPAGAADRHRVKLEEMGENVGIAVSSFENNMKQWVVEILANHSLESQKTFFQEYFDQQLMDGYLIDSAKLPDKDWVKESEQILAPFKIGKFFIFGSFFRGKLPARSFPLRIDAGLAFGTGRHETTAGCLTVLQTFFQRKQQFHNILDMGTGSAILAMAAASLWPKAWVVGVDNDYEALEVARENILLNELKDRIQVHWSNGYGTWVKKQGPYDLITANILAHPLCDMAAGLANNLALNGVAVLSGLLISQEEQVEKAQQKYGLIVEERLRMQEWTVLVVRHQQEKRINNEPKEQEGELRKE